MKKFLSIMLVIAMFAALFTMGSPVSAEENYTILFSATEETDMDVLLTKITQYSEAKICTARTAFEEFTVDGDEIAQLLEVRMYEDGRTEADYVSTTFSAVDENGEVVPLDAETIVGSDQNDGHTTTCYLQAYYTTDWGSNSNHTVFTYHHIAGKVLSNPYSYTIKISLAYQWQYDWGTSYVWKDYTVTTNAITNQMYYKNFSNFTVTVKNTAGGSAAAFGTFDVGNIGTVETGITFSNPSWNEWTLAIC